MIHKSYIFGVCMACFFGCSTSNITETNRLIANELSDAIARHQNNFARETIEQYTAQQLDRLRDVVDLSPLEAAVTYGNFEITELLVRKGCNVNYRSNLGNTLLHQSVHNNDYETSKLLLETGAKSNVKHDGETSLDLCYRNFEHTMLLAELLVKYGARRADTKKKPTVYLSDPWLEAVKNPALRDLFYRWWKDPENIDWDVELKKIIAQNPTRKAN